MIRNIHIRYFRSCRDVCIDNIGELTILVGRNGVGKSNILKAINWCAKTAIGNDALSFNNSIVASVKLEVLVDNKELIYEIDTDYASESGKAAFVLNERLDQRLSGRGDLINVFDKRGSELTINGNTRLTVSPTMPAIRALSSLLPLHPYSDLLQGFSQFLSKIEYYPLIELESAVENYSNAFISEELFAQWTATKTADNSTRTVLCKILDLYLNNNDKFEELTNLLGEFGIGVISDISINNFQVPKHFATNSGMPANKHDVNEPTNIYVVNFCPIMGSNKQEYRFDSLSFGTKRIIRFVTDFLYDNSSVSLLEQPEDGIHCGLLYKLFDLLKSYSEDRQTIVASHSADILNRAEPNSIQIVEMREGLTSVRQLTGREQQAATEYTKKTGNLADFIRSLQE